MTLIEAVAEVEMEEDTEIDDVSLLESDVETESVSVAVSLFDKDKDSVPVMVKVAVGVGVGGGVMVVVIVKDCVDDIDIVVESVTDGVRDRLKVSVPLAV